MKNSSEAKADFRPKGPYSVLIIPFNDDGTIDEAGLRREVEFLCNTGVSGLFPCGSTSEFMHLSPDENCRIMEIVADQAKGRKAILPGACSSNRDTTVKYIQHAHKLGCPAVVICPPYYLKLSQEDILQFYRDAAREAGMMNIILYNIPAFTNPISFEVFKELIKEPNIVAIKDSSANIKNIMHLIDWAKNYRPDFCVMTGTDDALFPALMAGCTGSMTAMGTIVPEVITGIYDAYYRKDFAEALKLQHSIMELLRLADSLSFPAGYKLVLENRGIAAGRPKLELGGRGKDAYRELGGHIQTELAKILGSKVQIP